MVRFRLALLASSLLVTGAMAAPASARDCRGADVLPAAGNHAQVRHATLCLLNVERRAHGLHKLHGNRRLNRAATRYSRLMAAQNFFDHVSPAGSTLVTRVKRTRYLRHARGWALGENIAWGTGPLATPRQTVRAWMNSDGHRHNILNGSFREIGIGVATGAPVPVAAAAAGATYTTDFGYRG